MINRIFEIIHSRRYDRLSAHEKIAAVERLAALAVEHERLKVYALKLNSESHNEQLGVVLSKLNMTAKLLEDGPAKDAVKGASLSLRGAAEASQRIAKINGEQK